MKCPFSQLATNLPMHDVLDYNPMVDGKQEELPGPGAYDSRNVASKSSPGFMIGKATRSGSLIKKSERENPGVGLYSPRQVDKKHAPNYSMGKKIKEMKNSAKGAISPGPAVYANSLSPAKRSIS